MKVIIMELPLYTVDDDDNLTFLNEEEARYALEDFISKIDNADMVISGGTFDHRCIPTTQARIGIADAHVIFEEDKHICKPIISRFIVQKERIQK